MHGYRMFAGGGDGQARAGTAAARQPGSALSHSRSDAEGQAAGTSYAPVRACMA